ncbi:MAG: hypothetical protein LBK58_09125, partial [Prevotellaceae bacterium]|nr:hypothetical protein [Prevotellaceae bacterium]
SEKMDFNSYERLITHSDYTELSRPFLETENFIYYSITDRAKRKQGDQHYRRRNKPYWFNKKKGTSFELGQAVEDHDVYHFFGMPTSIYGNHYAELIPNIMIEGIRSGIKERSDLFKNRELRDMIMDKNPDLEAILVLYEFKDSW